MSAISKQLSQLEALLTMVEQPDIDIDSAAVHYQKATKLAAKLTESLAAVKTKITTISESTRMMGENSNDSI